MVMEGVSRPAGSGVAIEWNGKAVMLEPLGLKQWGEIEQHLISLRPDPIQVAARIKSEMGPLQPEAEEKLIAEAYRDAKQTATAADDEVMAFVSTPRGLAFAFWRSFEKQQPGEYSLEEVVDIMSSLSPAEVEQKVAALMQASGLDERGNSSGRPRRMTRQERRRRQRTGRKDASSTGGSTSVS